MSERTSPYDDIIVRVVPARRVLSDASPQHSRDGIYEALIYTNVSAFQRQASPPPGQPDQLANLPLASVEKLVIHWDDYPQQLAWFMADSQSTTQRKQLFDTMSSGLSTLLSGRFQADAPVRIWWSNESSELEELPWELVVYNSPDFVVNNSCFVRGLPPRRRPPIVPVEETLRLGVIFDSSNPPFVLLEALKHLPGIEVIHLTQPPRQALRRVVSERYELLHIVADGYVSLARDGILYVHDAYRPELTSSELSAILRSSRVMSLALSSTASAEPDLVEREGHQALTSRAFAYLANAQLPLPSIVAPLAPLSAPEVASFWREFYPTLAKTLSIEEAMIHVQKLAPKAMGLFLRQFYGRLFRRSENMFRSLSTSNPAPTKIEAELQISQTLVARLTSLRTRYGKLPESVTDFLMEEKKHQKTLEAQLVPWTQVQVEGAGAWLATA